MAPLECARSCSHRDRERIWSYHRVLFVLFRCRTGDHAKERKVRTEESNPMGRPRCQRNKIVDPWHSGAVVYLEALINSLHQKGSCRPPVLDVELKSIDEFPTNQCHRFLESFLNMASDDILQFWIDRSSSSPRATHLFFLSRIRIIPSWIEETNASTQIWMNLVSKWGKPMHGNQLETQSICCAYFIFSLISTPLSIASISWTNVS